MDKVLYDKMKSIKGKVANGTSTFAERNWLTRMQKKEKKKAKA